MKTEINVKRIFFEHNNVIPSFELESGEIKRPAYGSLHIPFCWLTDKEQSEMIKTIAKVKNKKWYQFWK